MSKNNRINKVKEQKNRYVYYIYMVGFVALMFILVVLSMAENSKKVQISEKNKETLSKNIKNAEKNYDSQILNRYNSTIKSVDSVNVVSNDDKEYIKEENKVLETNSMDFNKVFDILKYAIDNKNVNEIIITEDKIEIKINS